MVFLFPEVIQGTLTHTQMLVVLSSLNYPLLTGSAQTGSADSKSLEDNLGKYVIVEMKCRLEDVQVLKQPWLVKAGEMDLTHCFTNHVRCVFHMRSPAAQQILKPFCWPFIFKSTRNGACCCSVAFDSLWPHELQHARLPISWSLLKLMSIELVMPFNHLIPCRPLLLLPSVFPSIRVFSNESVLLISWTKFWHFSFSISPFNEMGLLLLLLLSRFSRVRLCATP